MEKGIRCGGTLNIQRKRYKCTFDGVCGFKTYHGDSYCLADDSMRKSCSFPEEVVE